MSKQLTSEKACKQKTTYYSGENARQARKRRNKAAGYEYLRNYKCDSCTGWHVTSQKKDEESNNV